MIGPNATGGRTLFCIGCTLAVLGALASCNSQHPNRLQGYVEGEFVYVASPLAGQLESLNVQRGQQVKAGDPLFALDSQPEKDALDRAKQQLAQARSNLEDAKKPRRPTEIESIEAQLEQARAAAVFSEKDFERQKELEKTGARAMQDLDRARSTRDQDHKRVAQLEADLETARLGSRIDQIAAAEATVKAQEAALATAEWNLAQKRQNAPQAGVVFDTLYREGEWVGAGRPVVALLPPPNVKVRAFIPETEIGKIKYGEQLQVYVDGLPEPLIGKVSFISPRVEYTPPVIYSQESRSKLVVMIELRFDPKTAAILHPGQPVDVQLGS
jgi:HlyD family secretion protein